MSTEVNPGDWGEIEPWWSAYTQTFPVSRSPVEAGALDRVQANMWEGIHPWWQTGLDGSPRPHAMASPQTLITERLTETWAALDPWWDAYTETGTATAVEIATLLEQSNQEWTQSAAPFDADPLASAVTDNRVPFLPEYEEGWSDWLATVLRQSSTVVAECFDVAVDQLPEQVVREDQLSKEDGGFRRPDILVLYPERGLSIEVKIDDTQYRKTAETAELIEREYPERDWTHTLLLPERNIGRLRTRVEPPVTGCLEDGLQIEWTSPGPVSVVRWRDLTTAIRTVFRQGDTADEHWAANTYLFCGAVEQQIAGFQPQPVVERLAAPTSVVDVVHQMRHTHALEEQLYHLRSNRDT